MRPAEGADSTSRAWLLALVVVALVCGGGDAALASLGLAVAAPGRAREMPGLLGSIVSGSIVVGGLGWVAGALVVGQVQPELTGGLGIAVGGGVGALAWLLAVGDEDESGPETVAVDMEDAEDGPTPRPADLFAASPDPIVFFAGDPPQVRAVNQAFQRVFDVSSTALADAPLGDVLDFHEDTGLRPVLEAGEAYDEVVDCRVAGDTRPMRVRLVAPEGTSGYLVYTPVDADDG